MVQVSHPYMTTGKTIALTRQTFVGKVMSLLFNMLSRFVIAFLPRSKCLLISWLQLISAVIVEPKKMKSVTFSTFSQSLLLLKACHIIRWKQSLHWQIDALRNVRSICVYVYAAAAAKSLQSCPTLCDPKDGSPPGSSVPGILQARTLEWAATSFSNGWKWMEYYSGLNIIYITYT